MKMNFEDIEPATAHDFQNARVEAEVLRCPAPRNHERLKVHSLSDRAGPSGRFSFAEQGCPIRL